MPVRHQLPKKVTTEPVLITVPRGARGPSNIPQPLPQIGAVGRRPLDLKRPDHSTRVPRSEARILTWAGGGLPNSQLLVLQDWPGGVRTSPTRLPAMPISASYCGIRRRPRSAIPSDQISRGVGRPLHLPVRREPGRRPLRADPELRGRVGWSVGPSTAPGLENDTGGAVDREDIGGGHCDAAICAPVTGTAGEMWSSRRCARVASISRSALMRTSAAVARSTTSSLVNASALRVLSRRANSCMLIICSHILELLLTQRNQRCDRLFLSPPRAVGKSPCAKKSKTYVNRSTRVKAGASRLRAQEPAVRPYSGSCSHGADRDLDVVGRWLACESQDSAAGGRWPRSSRWKGWSVSV